MTPWTTHTHLHIYIFIYKNSKKLLKTDGNVLVTSVKKPEK